MDNEAVLAAFDTQIRRSPPDVAGTVIEQDSCIVRTFSPDGWVGVTWSELEAATADEVIRAQIERFGTRGSPWEWKHYSYDRPADLASRLTVAGFVPEPAETLLVADLAAVGFTPPPPGIELREVADASDVAALVALHDEVFGGDHGAIGRALLDTLGDPAATTIALLAVAGQSVVSAGRVEFHLGTEFASLWGGGTRPSWRGRGVFRSLVSRRAVLASQRGYRYLQVDASSDSSPILQRLGFVELAITTPFIHPGTRS